MILFSENRQFPLFKCFYGPWTQYSNINNSKKYLYFYFIFLAIFGYIYIFGSPPLTLKSVLPTMHMIPIFFWFFYIFIFIFHLKCAHFHIWKCALSPESSTPMVTMIPQFFLIFLPFSCYFPVRLEQITIFGSCTLSHSHIYTYQEWSRNGAGMG